MKREFDGSIRAAGICTLGATALLSTLLCLDLRAEVPGEVTGLVWCPGAKDCLSWSVTPGAATYRLYRGAGPDLSGLLNGSTDSCTVGSYGTATTGRSLDDPPPPGELSWFLVTAGNADGEGSAGQASAGPRSLDSSGACSGAGGVVINEVDYDQPGVDSGEFIEVYNGHTADLDLSGLRLILVNGGTQEEYLRIDLGEAGPSLPAGGYLVVGAAGVVATLPPGTPAIAFGSATNNTQNGAPDGIALFDIGTSRLIDALSYEGSITAAQFDGIPGTFDLVQGTPATAQDSNGVAGSLGRSPNGSNTGDADTDWEFNPTRSPGLANPAP